MGQYSDNYLAWCDDVAALANALGMCIDRQAALSSPHQIIHEHIIPAIKVLARDLDTEREYQRKLFEHEEIASAIIRCGFPVTYVEKN